MEHDARAIVTGDESSLRAAMELSIREGEGDGEGKQFFLLTNREAQSFVLSFYCLKLTRTTTSSSRSLCIFFNYIYLNSFFLLLLFIYD